MTKLKNPIVFLKTNNFKSHNRPQISTNNDGLSCENYLRKPIGPVNNETNSRPYKKQQIYKEAKTSKNFARSHCSKHYNYKMLPAKTLYRHIILILASKGLPYKRTM